MSFVAINANPGAVEIYAREKPKELKWKLAIKTVNRDVGRELPCILEAIDCKVSFESKMTAFFLLFGHLTSFFICRSICLTRFVNALWLSLHSFPSSPSAISNAAILLSVNSFRQTWQGPRLISRPHFRHFTSTPSHLHTLPGRIPRRPPCSYDKVH